MFKIAKKYPFTSATLLGLLLSTVVNNLGIQYDSGGVASLLFFFALVLQFPVWISQELIFSLPMLKAANANNILAIAAGFIIAFLIDKTLSTLLLRNKRK